MKMNRVEKVFVNSSRHARGNRKTIERMIGFLDLSGVKTVLEIGCGAGDLSAWLAATHDLQITGTDVDPAQVALANERHGNDPRLAFHTADAAALPFEEGSFDLVISFKVLHHIRDWQRALEEVKRVLKPGGYYLLNDFALSPLSCRVLGRVARNSGVYTIDDVSSALLKNDLSIAHSDPPKGVLFRHFSLVTRRAS